MTEQNTIFYSDFQTSNSAIFLNLLEICFDPGESRICVDTIQPYSRKKCICHHLGRDCHFVHNHVFVVFNVATIRQSLTRMSIKRCNSKYRQKNIGHRAIFFILFFLANFKRYISLFGWEDFILAINECHNKVHPILSATRTSNFRGC